MIFTLIFLLFKYNIEIRISALIISTEFIKNVIPSLFPILIISKYTKENIISKTNNRFIRYISLCLSFMPANAIVSNNEKELLYSSNVNPIFSYVMIRNILGSKKAIIIVLINLFVNYFLLYKNVDTTNHIDNSKKDDFINIIKSSSKSLIYIYGTIFFCNIIYTLLKIFISNKFLFFIEITNGFKIISSFMKYKTATVILLNSFGGLSFMLQIKSIKTNISRTFIMKRIAISIFVLILTEIILMSYFII